MGLNWMIIDDDGRKFCILGKKGEWDNEYHNLISFLQSSTLGRVRFIADNNPEWNNITSDYENAEINFDEEELDWLVSLAKRLTLSAHTVLYKTHIKMERERRKGR